MGVTWDCRKMGGARLRTETLGGPEGGKDGDRRARGDNAGDIGHRAGPLGERRGQEIVTDQQAADPDMVSSG